MPIIDPANLGELARYERFVRTSPYAAATQDTGWSEVKSNWTPLYVYLEERGEMIAAMSVLMVSAIEGKMLAYCCKGPVCNPRDVQLVHQLMQEAEAAVRERGAFVLRIDPETAYDETLHKQFAGLGYVLRNRNVSSKDTTQPRYNMVLDLKGKTEEELLDSFHSKTRYNIRLAERKGVRTRYSQESSDLEIFHQLYVVMSDRHGISYRPYNYFASMLEAYRAYTRVYLAEYEGVAIAASVAISYGDKTWYIYGASANEHRNVMAPHLLQWEMIKWAVEQGKGRYDFGGVFELDASDGLYRFKEGFCYPDRYTEYIGEIDSVLDEEAYQKFIQR